jgi:hypothetical protein
MSQSATLAKILMFLNFLAKQGGQIIDTPVSLTRMPVSGNYVIRRR